MILIFPRSLLKYMEMSQNNLDEPPAEVLYLYAVRE